ncbi:MAG: EAL domain-containing protein [Spirochaetes bacterium]|nr:EAL domain-containing protein [Spirochaetota bacterium]
MAPLGLAEFLLPAFCAGVLFTGTMLFSFLSMKGRETLHRVMVLLGGCAFVFVFSETLLLGLGGNLGRPEWARQFHRLEQMSGAYFLFALPLLLNFILTLPRRLVWANRALSWTGLAAALAITAGALLSPDAFISQSIPKASAHLSAADLGRGQEGWLYGIRDILLGVSITYTLVLCAVFLPRQRRRRYAVPVLLGLLLAFYGAADDIFHVYTGWHADPLSSVPFSRFSLGITLFVLGAMASTLMRFMDQGKDLRVAYTDLHELAYHDPLTGLPNRKAFGERLVETLAQARRSAHDGVRGVMLIDLDHFRIINDTWGNETGDEVLREVSRRLRAVLRQGDILARTGHDEFSVLLTTLDREESASVTAMKLLTSLSVPYAPYGKDLRLSANIGIATSPKDGNDAETLIRKSELALAQARREHTPFQFFTDRMQQDILRRMRMAERLRAGLARDEFHLFWQAQVDPLGRITGAEALVRWKPGERWIPPLEFIPIAEETRLILPLGEKILRMACAQQRAWHDQGLDLPRIGVNLSSLQLAQEGLVEEVSKILRETGTRGNQLELEITESGVMEDRDHIREKIQRILALGVTFAIDDFGTGYSSLAYLQRFPVQVLKIDQAFVRAMGDGNLNHKLIHAIVGLAKTFALEICAEGVETRAQADALIGLGCQRLQGYLYSKPISTEEFTALLRDGRALGESAA